jgi:tRNA/tmRNA/rRNA uracil-C5-methylase (TrmA/RlmC/RlmD family)
MGQKKLTSSKTQHVKRESWVSKLFSLLFAAREDLHIHSKKLQHYRNKITYNLPLEGLSPLAEMHLNEVCQGIHDWMHEMEQHTLFREVMAKSVRDGSMMIRLTVQRNINDGERDDHWNNLKDQFVKHLTKIFPAIVCICYNETFNQARPTKDVPIIMLFGESMHVLEHTHTGLPYQISPDAFCEINHEVEDLQSVQTIEWIKEFEGSILVCSGRDINSYGLGFGTIQDRVGDKFFSEVVAVQHCPLVAKDAEANYARHADKVDATVLHLGKFEMANGVKKALDAALERQNHPPVVVVTTGGRKGLNPLYVDLLKDHPAVKCIIYNSCSTKSLVRDVEDFLAGPHGYYIENFRSYDFFAGTGYTASVLKLLRRPKTLVLPIGPAGVGKSTLASQLTERSSPDTVCWWQRDFEFATMRDNNISMTKSKTMLHNDLLSFLNGHCQSVRIVDSTNGNAGARELYIQENQPDLVVLAVLQPTGKDEVDLVDKLLERTRGRLEDGSAKHPSFPKTVDAQRIKHQSILKGIEYPSSAELERLRRKVTRLVEMNCDPCDASQMMNVPFRVFLEYSVGDDLREVLRKNNDMIQIIG